MDNFRVANETIATTVEVGSQVYIRLDLPTPIWYQYTAHRLLKVCDERSQTLERHYECAQ